MGATGPATEGALARSLHLESPWIATRVVDVPAGDVRAAEWVVEEALAAGDHAECRYDRDGRRFEPVLEGEAVRAW